MPDRYRVPPQIVEAMLVVETGFPSQVLGEMPERLIEEIMVYKGVKNVTEYGGNWQP